MHEKHSKGKLDANLMQTKHANRWRTCLVQLPGQLHDGLHLLVVLEEALPEQVLIVGLVCLGLDGRLHVGLCHLRRRTVAVVPQVRHRVLLLCAPHVVPAMLPEGHCRRIMDSETSSE